MKSTAPEGTPDEENQRMRTADDYVLDFRHDDGSAMMANFHGVA